MRNDSIFKKIKDWFKPDYEKDFEEVKKLLNTCPHGNTSKCVECGYVENCPKWVK